MSAESLDDVIALAKTKVTDKVTTEQAIDDIVKKYPAFVGGGTTGTQTLNNPPSDELEDAEARKIMGLPAAK